MAPASILAFIRNQQPIETISTMELAASERLLDAAAIATGRPEEALGALYMLGYVVECSLKGALGHLSALLPAQNLYQGVLKPVSRTSRIDLHDLEALLGECLQARRSRGLPSLSPVRAGEWDARVGNVALSSAVDLGCRSVPVPLSWVVSTYSDAEWIVGSVRELWT